MAPCTWSFTLVNGQLKGRHGCLGCLRFIGRQETFILFHKLAGGVQQDSTFGLCFDQGPGFHVGFGMGDRIQQHLFYFGIGEPVLRSHFNALLDTTPQFFGPDQQDTIGVHQEGDLHLGKSGGHRGYTRED